MHASEGQGRVRGWAFLPTVLSSIATFAGMLVILASFYYGAVTDGQTSGDLFESVRWLAIGLTLVAAAVLAMSLAQFRGGRSLLQGKAALIVALVVALLLVGLLVRTMAI